MSLIGNYMYCFFEHDIFLDEWLDATLSTPHPYPKCAKWRDPDSICVDPEGGGSKMRGSPLIQVRMRDRGWKGVQNAASAYWMRAPNAGMGAASAGIGHGARGPGGPRRAPSPPHSELPIIRTNKSACGNGACFYQEKKKVPAATGQGLIKRKKCLRQGACNK